MKVSLTVAIIFILTSFFENVSTRNNEVDEKKEPNKYAPLWFGPRVGRKKRYLDDGYKNFDKEEIEVLLEFIRMSPCTIMLFGNGKSHLVNFNPKEERGVSEDDEITELVQRSMFAPRLGRSAFHPRLGRGNDILD